MATHWPSKSPSVSCLCVCLRPLLSTGHPKVINDRTTYWKTPLTHCANADVVELGKLASKTKTLIDENHTYIYSLIYSANTEIEPLYLSPLSSGNSSPSTLSPSTSDPSLPHTLQQSSSFSQVWFQAVTSSLNSFNSERDNCLVNGVTAVQRLVSENEEWLLRNPLVFAEFCCAFR